MMSYALMFEEFCVLARAALLAQVCPVPTRVILLMFFGPFVLAGVLLIAALVVWFWNRRAAGACLLSAAVFLPDWLRNLVAGPEPHP